MHDFETVCYQDRAHWQRLLAAYALAEDALVTAEAEQAKSSSKNVPVEDVSALTRSDADVEESTTGWLTRISQLEGVDTTQLSTLHGRVIALGLLKFKLIDRQVGLRYRLTPAGRQAAKANSESADAISDAA